MKTQNSYTFSQKQIITALIIIGIVLLISCFAVKCSNDGRVKQSQEVQTLIDSLQTLNIAKKAKADSIVNLEDQLGRSQDAMNTIISKGEVSIETISDQIGGSTAKRVIANLNIYKKQVDSLKRASSRADYATKATITDKIVAIFKKFMGEATRANIEGINDEKRQLQKWTQEIQQKNEENKVLIEQIKKIKNEKQQLSIQIRELKIQIGNYEQLIEEKDITIKEQNKQILDKDKKILALEDTVAKLKDTVAKLEVILPKQPTAPFIGIAQPAPPQPPSTEINTLQTELNNKKEQITKLQNTIKSLKAMPSVPQINDLSIFYKKNSDLIPINSTPPTHRSMKAFHRSSLPFTIKFSLPQSYLNNNIQIIISTDQEEKVILNNINISQNNIKQHENKILINQKIEYTQLGIQNKPRKDSTRPHRYIMIRTSDGEALLNTPIKYYF